MTRHLRNGWLDSFLTAVQVIPWCHNSRFPNNLSAFAFVHELSPETHFYLNLIHTGFLGNRQRLIAFGTEDVGTRWLGTHIISRVGMIPERFNEQVEMISPISQEQTPKPRSQQEGQNGRNLHETFTTKGSRCKCFSSSFTSHLRYRMRTESLNSPEEVLRHWQGDVLVQVLNLTQKSCSGVQKNSQVLKKEVKGETWWKKGDTVGGDPAGDPIRKFFKKNSQSRQQGSKWVGGRRKINPGKCFQRTNHHNTLKQGGKITHSFPLANYSVVHFWKDSSNGKHIPKQPSPFLT